MTCAAAVSVEAPQTDKRVDSPRSFCTSPSSISDVDFSRSVTDKATPASHKVQTDAESGDECDEPKAQDGMRALRPASDSVDINEALAHPVSSSQSLKRKADEESEGEQHQVTKKTKTEKQLTPAEADSDYLPTDIEEEDEEGLYLLSVSRDGYADDSCAPGCVAMSSAADVECSSESTGRHSRRTLYIEYWSRTDECKERKWDHLDEIAENYGSPEEHIFATTLKGQSVSRDGYADDSCAPGCVAMTSAADVECSSESTGRHSRRTLYIEYWSRTDECKERKWDHLDEIAENYGSPEEHIFATTLK
ncbi:LOW QUALITY PROTEIN: Hypothetical protein PHPALM_2255, partial [Phytophthora palmivora]